MTVQTSTNTTSHVQNSGTNVDFAYNFVVMDSAHMQVYVNEVLESTANYTVENIGNPTGGNVKFNTAPAVNSVIRLTRIVPLDQLTDYRPYDPFPAETHEDALDKLTMIDQQQQEQLSRALISEPGSSGGYSVKFTEPVAGNLLAFDNDGNFIINIPKAEDKAYQWAETDENVVVENRDGRDRYSSYHWAQKAANISAWGLANAGDIYVGDGSLIPATVLPIGTQGQFLTADPDEGGTPGSNPVKARWSTVQQVLPALNPGDKLRILQVKVDELGYELTSPFGEVIHHAKDMLDDDESGDALSSYASNFGQNVVRQFDQAGSDATGMMTHLNNIFVRKQTEVPWRIILRLVIAEGTTDPTVAANQCAFEIKSYTYDDGSGLTQDPSAVVRVSNIELNVGGDIQKTVPVVFSAVFPIGGVDTDVLAAISIQRVVQVANNFTGTVSLLAAIQEIDD